MKRLLLISSAVGLCLAAPAFAQSTTDQDQLNRQKAAPSSTAAPAAQSQDRQQSNQPMNQSGQAQQRPATGSPSPSAQAPSNQDQSGRAQNQQQPSSGAPASSAQAPAPSGQAQSPAADQTQRGQAQNQQQPSSGAPAASSQAPAPSGQAQSPAADQRQRGQAQNQRDPAADRNKAQAPRDQQQQRSATDRNQPQSGQADRRQSQQDMQRQDRRQDAQNSRSQRDRASTSLNVDINETQRTRIASAISSVNVRPVNVNFRIATGVVVPRTVVLHTLPTSIVEVVPQFRGYNYFVTSEQIVIVEPRRKTVVAVLPAGGTARAQAPASNRASFTDQNREVIRSRASSLRSTATTGSSASRIVVEQEVPATIELEEFPAEIVTEVPVVRTYRYFRQDDDVFVVDPVQRRVIEIIR